MVTAVGMSHKSLNNVLVQRPFLCLDSTATLPSPSTIKNKLLQRFEKIKEKLLDALPDDGSKVSLALDGWSPHDMSSYMAIIAYFIDAEWKYHEVVIGFEYIEGKHTGERLADVLTKVVREYGIEHRIYAIISDNASNMQTMFDSAILAFTQRNKKVKRMSVEQSSEHIPCLAHTIQLALKALLGAMHISPTNEQFQRGWDEQQDSRDFQTGAQKILPLTLAKVREFSVDRYAYHIH